jgi:hypothetical protein
MDTQNLVTAFAVVGLGFVALKATSFIRLILSLFVLPGKSVNIFLSISDYRSN